MADDKSTARCPATHRNTNVLEVAPKHCRWLLCHYSIFPHFFLIFFSGGLLFFSAPPAPSIKKKREEFPFFFLDRHLKHAPSSFFFSFLCFLFFFFDFFFFVVEVFLFATDRFLWLQRWEKDIRLPLPVSRIAVPLIVRLGVSVSVIETDSSKKKNSTKPGKTQ